MHSSREHTRRGLIAPPREPRPPSAPHTRSQRLAPHEPLRGAGGAQLVRDVVGLRQPLGSGSDLQLPDRRGLDGVVICAGRVG
eukprot:scaffold105867_cov60-Phaeocystis_antarctica.AAC.2